MGKLLDFAGAAFDPVVMRWYYGNTDRYKVQSEVFKNGYEDPTYLTFRVEFGEWGASVLHRNTFTMQGGRVLDVLHQDYDQLPNGLLDLHFMEETLLNNTFDVSTNGETQKKFVSTNYYAFNNQRYYNAYNYLLQRNEDARAEYLKAFIIGLYEIQRDHPYLFQSISGLDALSAFTPESGQRLAKDTFVTIECIEGLSLKIKTLLQLYRKAAWDDAWQRWVLPLNMRQFKMIIYVFERRIFQHVQQANPISGLKSQHEINQDIPVYAFECNPCEFVIENIWKNDYDAKWGTDEETTKITIRVNNVMTYYRNGLLEDKLNNILIYDLFDSIDRSTLTSAKYTGVYNTFNEAKGNFLKKNVLLENEDMTASLKNTRVNYGSGADLLDSHSSIAQGYNREIVNTMAPNSLLSERVKANWWHEATVKGRDYWSSMSGWDGLFGGNTWKNIGKGLLDVITAATTQIRVSQNYSTHNSTVFYNILDYIETEGSPAEETYSMATDYILPIRKDLKHNADRATRGESSWATRTVGEGQFMDQSLKLDGIDSDALTEGDFSWATDDKEAEHNHDWTKYNGRTDKRQKQPFTWNGIDSSLMTGGDYSWGTADYTATGEIKGNDWTNQAQYKTQEVPRQKNKFNWNSIDSRGMTGDDYSWATDDPNNPNDHKWEDFDADHMQDGQRQKQPFNWNDIDSETLSNNQFSTATQDGNKIQDALDRDKLSEYDFSWATKGEGDHEHDSEMTFLPLDGTERDSVIDSQIESGRIDSEEITNHDYSWATQDPMNEYDHPVVINGGVMDASTRNIDSNIQVSLDEPRINSSSNLIPLDDDNRQQNKNVNYIDFDSSRGFDDTFIDTDFYDREMNHQMPPILSQDTSVKNFDLRTVEDSSRGINDEIQFGELEEREINNKILETPLKERSIDDPNFNNIEKARELPEQQYGELQDPREKDELIYPKLDNERTLPDDTLNKPDGERVYENNLRETDYKDRIIKHNVQRLPYQDREQNNTVQLSMEEPRILPDFQNNGNLLEDRHIIDQALRQPDKEKQKPLYSLNELDTHQRGINDNSYFSLQNTERYIDNTIQIENFDERVINEQLLRNLNGEERKQAEVTLNRLDVLNYISKATNASFTQEFREVDQESARIDATAKEMLQNSEAFKSLQYNDDMKDDDMTQVLAFAKAYSDESDAMKKAFVTRIQGLQKELREQTYNIVRDIPEMEYQTITDEKQENREPILLTVEEVRQIKDNVKLASLAESEVRDLSYKGLISLHDTLENNIVKTMIMQKPETVDDRSIATDLDNPPKPIINGKVEEGAAKNKANNITNATVSGPRKKERPILGHRLDKSARKKED